MKLPLSYQKTVNYQQFHVVQPNNIFIVLVNFISYILCNVLNSSCCLGLISLGQLRFDLDNIVSLPSLWDFVKDTCTEMQPDKITFRVTITFRVSKYHFSVKVLVLHSENAGYIFETTTYNTCLKRTCRGLFWLCTSCWSDWQKKTMLNHGSQINICNVHFCLGIALI